MILPQVSKTGIPIPQYVRKRPSPWSIVWTDNVCFRMTTLGPILFGFVLMIWLTGTIPGGRGKPDQPVDPQVANLLLAGATALILFLAVIVKLRVSRILWLFDCGQEVEATVRKVKRFKGGTTLKLEFQRADVTYQVRSVFQRWSRTPSFDEGERISLLVDPLHPKRAVLLALYAAPSTTTSRRGS